ncbi:MAG: succinate dehydrogenase cytochrome b subunit [Planctomycetota bacterium]|jgi:succinate dehydrogenase / fumarate reductase cytochrome b subunit|nr:succinate dehydrogenase cytochrome b subunit [Planctomycetota bacterium]
MSLGTTMKSSIGAKALMAITGIILVLFVIGHMIGNLQVFLGPDALNQYAHTLQSLGPILWVIRLALLTTLIAHIWSAAVVVRMSVAARPVDYRHRKDLATGFAARTMLVSGIVVALFIVYHVLHFTTGTIDMAQSYGHLLPDGGHDVYKMVVEGFQHPFTTIVYCLATVVLCLHLSHGISSLMQTLGVRKDSNAACIDKVGPVLAAIILIGNLSIPLAALTGLIK